MRRLFWLGLGVAAGVAIARKATATTKQLTPSGIAENLGDAVRELAGAVGSFGADVRAGMTEREDELADVVARAQEPLGSRSRRRNRPARESGGQGTGARDSSGRDSGGRDFGGHGTGGRDSGPRAQNSRDTGAHRADDAGWLTGLDESPRSGSEGSRRARWAEG
ncbi:hypothetical protein [Crossiella cryophila]|uniref:Secreted protein n=1 Tax=Crossiella cryophila TaxID=43355 RepID=A0A7W7FX31_9PSEU|nr:hypothetical protein [Crossiella cryophila]